jgi:hypothetical protein
MTTPPRAMPIFTRTFDLLSWLLPVPRQVPRAHRQVFTRPLLDAAGDPREALERANLARGVRRHRQLTPTPAVLAVAPGGATLPASAVRIQCPARQSTERHLPG